MEVRERRVEREGELGEGELPGEVQPKKVHLISSCSQLSVARSQHGLFPLTSALEQYNTKAELATFRYSLRSPVLDQIIWCSLSPSVLLHKTLGL